MNILNQVKYTILLKKIDIFLLSTFFISFIMLLFTITNPYSDNMLFKNSFGLLITFSALGIYYSTRRLININISHLLLYISHNPNKHNKIVQKLLLKYELSILIDNVDLIENTLNQNDWLLNNIHHFNKLRALKSKKFITYLNKFEYSTIEYYFKEEINLMEFEINNEYSDFIKLIKDKKSSLEHEVKENKEYTLPEPGITMVKGFGSVEII